MVEKSFLSTFQRLPLKLFEEYIKSATDLTNTVLNKGKHSEIYTIDCELWFKWAPKPLWYLQAIPKWNKTQ